MNILCLVIMISMTLLNYLRSEEIDPFSDAAKLESLRPLTAEEIAKIAKNIANDAPLDLKNAWEINVSKETVTLTSRKKFIDEETRSSCQLCFEMKLINRISNEEILKRVKIKNEKTLKLNFGTKDKDEWVKITEEISMLDVPAYSYAYGNVLICVKKGIKEGLSSVCMSSANESPLFNDIEKYISMSNKVLFELPLGVVKSPPKIVE